MCAVIAIRGTLSAEDLITDFMCEPADMDDWMSTAATPHSGQGQGSHDPKGLVGSSQGTGFFSKHSSAQKRTAGTPQMEGFCAIRTTRQSQGMSGHLLVYSHTYCCHAEPGLSSLDGCEILSHVALRNVANGQCTAGKAC